MINLPIILDFIDSIYEMLSGKNAIYNLFVLSEQPEEKEQILTSENLGHLFSNKWLNGLINYQNSFWLMIALPADTVCDDLKPADIDLLMYKKKNWITIRHKTSYLNQHLNRFVSLLFVLMKQLCVRTLNSINCRNTVKVVQQVCVLKAAMSLDFCSFPVR